MKTRKDIKDEAKTLLKNDYLNITVKIAALLLVALLVNNIHNYGSIFVTLISPFVIYYVIKTSFEAFKRPFNSKFTLSYYCKVFVLTLMSSLITLFFTLISASFFARGVIFADSINLLLGNVALILGLILAAWFEYTYFFVPFLAYENPQLSLREVFSQSKQLIKGYRIKALILSLSFFGWILLAIIPSVFIELALNIDSTLIVSTLIILTICPYIILSFTVFYIECKELAIVINPININE